MCPDSRNTGRDIEGFAPRFLAPFWNAIQENDIQLSIYLFDGIMKFYTLHFLHNLFMKDKTCCHGDDGTENSLNIVCSVNITILIFCSDLLWFWASLGFPNVH